MRKKFKWLPFIILSWLPTSCALKPPDVVTCEHFAQRLSSDPITGHLLLTPSPTCMKEIGEPECGHCVYIVSGREIFLGENDSHFLNGKSWSKLRQQSIYLPAKESYAPLSAFIINACEKMNCSDDVARFKVKVDSLNGISGFFQSPPLH